MLSGLIFLIFLTIFCKETLSASNSISSIISPDSFWEDFKSYESNEDFQDVWLTSEKLVDEGDRKLTSGWRLFRQTDKKLSKNAGMIVKSPDSISMIGRRLEKPIPVYINDTLVIQYEVKAIKKPKCDGAFLKLFQDMSTTDLLNYDSKIGEEYSFLIGPDYCIPDTNKVRFEMQNQETVQLIRNPISKLNDDLMRTHLYTFQVNFEDKSVELRIDGKVVLSASTSNNTYFSTKDNKKFGQTRTKNGLLLTINSLVFDFWGSTSGLIFNNIYIGKDIFEAEKLGNMTYLRTRKDEDDELNERLKFNNHGKNANSNKIYTDDESSGNIFDILIDKIIEAYYSDQIWENNKYLIVTLFVTLISGIIFHLHGTSTTPIIKDKTKDVKPSSE